MTFEEILDQAMAMLQRRGRVTYRTLRLQFQLDEEQLEALKEALIDAERLAVDEEGRVLVWAGPPASPPTASASQGATQDNSPDQALPVADVPATAAGQGPHLPDAERRQLTVMFCDLVESTKLASQLDPEDWRDVVRAYQRVCTDVIQRYDGHIAQLLGDGLLAYFGYPVAHEDDAQRAVRTGLGMLAAMGDLNQDLSQAKGVQLAIRVGVHTGLVVVGKMGGAGRQEQLALGEVPNIASRIEGLAAPNTIAVSEATYRLIQGYFECQDLGAQTLRGIAEPVTLYCVLSESGAQNRLDIVSARGLTPLVGREQEVGLLVERWEQAKAGQGHVVLLMGDPGIGKSRLVQMLKEHLAQEPHVRWECRSAEYYQNTALFPLVELFQRLLRFEAHETPDTKLEKLTHALSQYRLPLEETVPLLASILSLTVPDNHYPLLNVSPQRQRQKTLETIIAILLELAEHQPVLFIVEDLHWTDPTTLELLNLVFDQTPTASMLVLLTCRPQFQPAWHHRSYLTAMTLHPLSPAQVAQIVLDMTDGKTLPHEVLAQVIEKTDGVPLFVEELTKVILESGHLKAVDDHYELTGALSTLAIPVTLQDSLMARLDRLMTGKVIAQLGATIGRQFSYALLQAIAQLNDRTLYEELHRLVEAELLYQRGVPPQATYTFKHALIQDTAYASLLKSTRQQYHQRIAQVLEAQFPETAEAAPELLAHHYTEAGLREQAVDHWQRAGQRAAGHSAHVEAISHFHQALAVLALLPDTPEGAQQELTLQRALGASLLATRGFAAPEVEHVYTRARALCQRLGETREIFPVLFGLWGFYEVRGDLQTARELAEHLLTLAQGQHDPALLLQGHRALGDTLFWLGELVPARAHLEQGMALYNPQQHRTHALLYGQDPDMGCRVFAAHVLWMLGYPDQALQRSQEALTLAHELSHPFSLAFALNFAVRLHGLRREWPAAQERAEALIAMVREQGFAHWLASGRMQWGWTLASQGQGEAGITQIRQGLAAHRATGAKLGEPYALVWLAEAYGAGGQPEEGLRVLAEAGTVADNVGAHWYEAERHRVKGALLLALSVDYQAEAEACFQQALDVARRQEAKSLELRAAMSLSRLWQQQSKQDEARALLAPIFGWFTEGFDTADLQEAKALLDALA